MSKFKFWLILFSIGLILFDHYSIIRSFRDNTIILLQKQAALLLYRVQNYPKLVFLQVAQQKELAHQNVQLKKQVEEYSLLLQQSKNQADDLKSIKELNPAGIYDSFDPVVARAIMDINFFVNNQMLIDKGNNSHLTLGSAIVNRDGVIGQISSLNEKNSQIMLLTNPDFKIYVQQKMTKSKMLAQGAGNNTIIVRYIAKNDKIQTGDILETTGLDDVYPSGIPVARVLKVFYENNGFNSAICAPMADFHKLQYVLVLKNDS